MNKTVQCLLKGTAVSEQIIEPFVLVIVLIYSHGFSFFC